MTALSPKIYAQASEAAKLLKQAERKIRVLRTLKWAPEIEADFLAGGGEVLPKPSYPKFDGAETRDALAKIKPLVSGEHPVLQWLSRTVTTLEHANNMLESIGTPDFYRHSKRLYGTPNDTMLDGKTRNIDLAKHLDTTLSGLSFEQLVLGGTDEHFGAEEFAKRLPGFLMAMHPRSNWLRICPPRCWLVRAASVCVQMPALRLWTCASFCTMKPSSIPPLP